MGHNYAIDYSTYCKIGSRTRTHVFEDSDLVGGNLEFVLEWDRGYIEPYLGDTTGTAISGKLIGLGTADKTWDGQTPSVVYDGAGGIKMSSAGSVGFSTNGFSGQTPWIARTTLDLRYTLKAGSGNCGIVVRYSSGNPGGNDFTVMYSKSLNKIRIEKGNYPSATTYPLTSTVTTTQGQSYAVRVTINASNVWEMFIDGVSQGTFTDSTYSDRGKFAFRFTDSDSVISDIKIMPDATCPATTWEVVNNDGVVVSSGAVSGYTVSVPDADLVQRNGRGPYGGYKLRLYGASVGNYGTAKGDCQFVRVKPSASFCPKPARQDFGPVNNDTDVPLRAYFGLGASRLSWAETNLRAMATRLKSDYVAYAYPARPRHIIGHLTGSGITPDDTTTITSTVNSYKDVIDAWEPLNEPNYSSYTGTTWAPKQVAFKNAVRAADPTAIVLGPNIVSYNLRYDTLWIKDFFTAGGNSGLDGHFSVHGYNVTNGDIHMAKYMLTGEDPSNLSPGVVHGLHAQTDPYGLTLWQTEQSFFSQLSNLSTPLTAHTWLAVQLMVQETRGITLERNVVWYDKSHGFSYTSFWEHGTGITSVPVMVRTMVAELGNRTFNSEYDLSDMNDVYVCAKWTDPGDGTAVVGVLAQSNNLPDVRFNLTGATSVVVVDAYGNEFTVNASAGVVTIPSEDLPHWVRLPSGVDMTIVSSDWLFGTNYAVTATPSMAGISGSTLWALSNVGMQFLQNTYMFGDSIPTQQSVASTMQQTSNTLPQTLTLALATPKQVGRVDVFCPPIAQVGFSTLLDFDIDVSADGSTWTTVYTGSPPAQSRTSSFVSNKNGANTTVDTWFDPPISWDVRFSNRTVSHVRLVIRDVSYGAYETSAASEALYGPGGYAKFIALSGVRIYENYTVKPSVYLLRAS